MNPLNANPRARQIAYYVAFVLGLALGATQIGYQAAEAGFPVWLKVALSVYAFLSAGLGLTAAQNVPSYQDVVEGEALPPQAERGAIDVGTAVLIAVLVVLILVLVGAFH